MHKCIKFKKIGIHISFDKYSKYISIWFGSIRVFYLNLTEGITIGFFDKIN